MDNNAMQRLEKTKNDIKVSVIIPVYNVEQYVDKCLESVVNQTYENIEILVMEAKSTDGSLAKVLEWAKNDDRFTVVSRRDGGLGPARNYALQLASGDFVCFLDSDDWIDLDYIEKTVDMALQDDEIDIVVTGRYIHKEDERVDRIDYSPWLNGTYGRQEEKCNILEYGHVTMWGKLIRRDVFERYSINQPALPYEDLATYPTLIAASRKIAICNDTFVHYLAERADCLSNKTIKTSFNKDNYSTFYKVISHGGTQLKKVVGYEAYWGAFCFLMYRHFYMLSRIWLSSLEKTKIIMEEIENNFYEYGFMKFFDLYDYKYYAYGSFPIRWTVHRLLYGKENLQEHYVFTSLISQMCNKCLYFNTHHENSFRQQAIEQDLNNRLNEYLSKGFDAEKNKEFFILDFLMECQDILEIETGHYITLSEALLEADDEIKSRYRIIKWDSQEFWDLWTIACERLIKQIRQNIKTQNIILVKYYLCEKYQSGDALIAYTDQNSIRKKNLLISKMYDFFQGGLPQVKCYELENQLTYTDMRYRGMDPRPDYLNYFAISAMAQEIETDLIEREWV